MPVPAAQLFDVIARDIADARRESMRAIRDDVKQRVSVPVERSKGRTIRSKPGEYPRKDKGELYESIQGDVIEAGDQIEGAVSTDKAYAPHLIAMQRLLITDRAAEYTDLVLDGEANAISNE